jgi:hypothetical protein
MGGTEPSAHALGYYLAALRAWGHGLGRTEADKVYRDLIRFFLLSFRYRCRCRCRSRRVGRGVAGRAHRPPGVCRFGGFVGWEQCPFATFCDFCGHPPGIAAAGSHAKNRPSTERVFSGNELAVDSASTFFDACAGWGHPAFSRELGTLCVLSEAGVRKPSERGVADRWVKKRGICRPAGAGFHGADGTQRSRAGLLSGGPPGLGPRLGEGRRCRGVSGSSPVLPFEFSIPMPMPIPIPTLDARGCRAGSSSAGGVSVRRLGRMGTASFCDVLLFLRPSSRD